MPDASKKSTPVTYADAGVDISSGDRAKQRIKYLAQRTFTKNVLSEIGGFGGLFKLDTAKFKQPVLVSSADGVGTKLKLAFETGIHHTVGADLVNHCVNDIAVQGATPLFFLDYLATGRLDAEVMAQVVEGLANACRANGCALIGGETAQMPGFYSDGEYDLAGFIVGAVDKEKLVTGANIKAGDVLIGLPSTGLHTNGYSLARKLFFEVAAYKPSQYVTPIKEKAGTALMKTHKSYL
ncbi:MAG: phosphoribosylformylglycinamidine cyclo-ligase, partial [Acidobacteriaceae bacterium]